MDLDSQIGNFFRTHPCLHIRCIERKLNLPVNSLRRNKPVPDRHKWELIRLLHDYGFEPIIPSTYGKENKLLLTKKDK